MKSNIKSTIKKTTNGYFDIHLMTIVIFYNQKKPPTIPDIHLMMIMNYMHNQKNHSLYWIKVGPIPDWQKTNITTVTSIDPSAFIL
jgi:hypothetical protein